MNRIQVVRIIRGSARVITLASVLVCVRTVYAAGDADPGSPAKPAEAAAPEQQVQEIVVTAQRRQEVEQKVPIAMTVINPEQMKDLGIVKVNDIDVLSSGLTMHNSDGALQPYIRGIGTTSALAGLESAVASYIDGAYLPQSLGVLTDLFDMESVQVLKGAQGTLWGSNASGGAILYNTANPVLGQTSAKLSAEYGDYNHGLAEAVVNLPVTDTLAVRLGAHGYTQDGYVNDIVTGQKLNGRTNVTLRGKIKWQPTDQFSAVFGIEYYDTHDKSNYRIMRSSAPLCGPCGLGISEPAPGFYESTVDGTTLNGERNSFTNTEAGENLHLNYSGDWFEANSMTSYRHNHSVGEIDAGNSFVPIFDFATDVLGRTFDQELQFSTKSDGFINGMIGLSYLHDTSTFGGGYIGEAFAPLVGLTGAYPSSTNYVTTSSYAGFGEIYLTPIDKLKITLGARYTHDRRDFSTQQNLAASIALAGDPAAPQYFATNGNFDKMTPRFVAAYDLNSVNLYASFNRGFKAGGYSTPTFTLPEPVKSETVDDYELGAKYVSPDSTLRVNPALFFYRYSDIQVTIDKNVSAPTVLNAASAHGYGAELDTSWQSAHWLKIFGNLAYLRANYTAFPGAAVAVVGPAGGLINGAVDLGGHRLPNAPEWSGTLGFNLNAPVSPLFIGNLNVVAHYTDDFDLQPGAGGPLGYAVQPTYTLMNISGYLSPQGLSSSGGFLGLKDYKIGFFINNVTNAQYHSGRFMITGAFGGLLDEVGSPRMYGMRLSASF